MPTLTEFHDRHIVDVGEEPLRLDRLSRVLPLTVLGNVHVNARIDYAQGLWQSTRLG